MADHRAVKTVCKAVVELLRLSVPKDFENIDLSFEVFLAKDYTSKKMEAGVSLFLYRIYPNGSNRSPSGRLREDGRRYIPRLPVDLHFLLTAWGKTADMQHTIAGWMMRTMEDNSIITPAFLNSLGPAPEVFHNDETVEISLTELATEDMLRLWELIGQNEYQLSVPYVARNVMVESAQLLTAGQIIQERKYNIKILKEQ